MNYELITARSIVKSSQSEGLNELIEEKLQAGFELYGSPGVHTDKCGSLYFQAVVKK